MEPNRSEHELVRDARPAARWWWFANTIEKADIDDQLAWAAANGFGRVEIAWVYPTDPDPAPARFLDSAWQDLVTHAARSARDHGLGCDFTLGTLWPFGGTFLHPDEQSLTADGPSDQRLTRSWEQAYADPAPILDHLNEQAVLRYGARITEALAPALAAATSPALFTDSWEVHTERLWAHGLDELFEQRFGYRIRDWVDRLDDDPHRRYDYRSLIGELVLERFFAPLARLCSDAGAHSRVQAHGAPTDLIAAYSRCDIPESETMLFDPPFALIAASAAALSGRLLVSCETFTCVYGWAPYPGPGPHQGAERVDDLKIVADAGFANGVNTVFWHGMPFQTAAKPARFYASTHLGPNAAFADRLPRFNAYLERVSAALREGSPHAQVACYLPTEAMQMLGTLAEPDRRPSALYHWEMHYVRPPEELEGHRPLWINAEFLASALVSPDGSSIRVGALSVHAIVVDTPWLPYDALAALARISEAGGRVVLGQAPAEPGTVRHPDYASLVSALQNPRATLDGVPALVESEDGESLPPFFCRRIDGPVPRLRYFFAHPLARSLRYPLPYGVAERGSPVEREVRVAAPGDGSERFGLTLRFGAAGAVLCDVDTHGVRVLDLDESFLGQ